MKPLSSVSNLLLVLVSGCGSVKPSSEVPDAPNAIDARMTADAPPPDAAAACDVNKPFGTPVRINELSTTYEDFFVRLSPDQLTAYTENNSRYGAGGGDHDLFVATRSSPTGTFSSLASLAALNGTSTDSSPTVTGDGLTIYFTSNRGNSSGAYDIYTASRASLTADFGAPATVAAVNTAGSEDSVYVLTDGNTLYLSRDGDLYVATKGAAGAFQTPQAIAALNTTTPEDFPVVTADELTIYYRTGTDGPTSEIYAAHRSTKADGFGIGAPVTELNSAAFDAPTWISPDGCELYLSSNRDGGVDLYVATRPH